MPYPRKLLNADEHVLDEMRPHWIRLAFPVAVTVLVAAISGLIYFTWSTAPTWVGVVLGSVVFLVMCWLFAKVIAWRATLLVLTSSRVIYRRGVVHRIGREIPIDRVQDVTYHQGLLERMLGAGALVVESAGEHGSDPFPDVRRPAALQSRINAAVDASRRGVTFAGSSLAEQAEELADLHRRGILTDDEYEEKRKDLTEGS